MTNTPSAKDSSLTRIADSKPSPDVPRKCPPKATPVHLPTYELQPLDAHDLLLMTADELRGALIGTHPSRWQANVHEKLGIELTNGLTLEKLVPREYIPPAKQQITLSQVLGDDDHHEEAKTATQKLSNGMQAPSQEMFLVQISELQCEYEDVLRILARERPRITSKVAKITHLRKFWTALDVVARYWDTSRDEHRPGTTDVAERALTHTADRKFNLNIPSPHQDSLAQRDDKSYLHAIANSTLHRSSPLTEKSQNRENEYYGWRDATGRDMPNMHRQELIANFIEPIVRAMGCHYESSGLRSELPLDSKRFVQVMDGRIRIAVSGLIYRLPTDAKAAREGWNEGPLVAVSARSSVSFSTPVGRGGPESTRTLEIMQGRLGEIGNDRKFEETFQSHGHTSADELPPRFAEWQNTDVIDASKEIGALLMLAQFRLRNARSEDEVVAGRGKWWAERRRYGQSIGNSREDAKELIRTDLFEGGKNGSLEPFSDDSRAPTTKATPDERRMVNALPADVETSYERDARKPLMAKRQRLSGDSGFILDLSHQEEDADRRKLQTMSRRPLPVWDAKTHFLPIGRAPNQVFDHVYLISSVFHHVSIVCMRVHPSMLEFLSSEAGKSTNCVRDMMRLEQFGLYIRRSRWYDLLLPQDRVDAFHAVWAVMRYMMRDTLNEGMDATQFARELSESGKIAMQSNSIAD